MSSSPEATLVVDLADLTAADIERVGGKAANLGELIRAGFEVPPGFCVTTAAYRLAVAATAVADGRIADAGTARAAVLRAAVPASVAAAIRTGYPGLADGADVPVAVRSSATAEDLPGASFAGQQDTYLNVVGIDAVIDAVHRCWASLWTDRAVAYRAAQGIDGAEVALAVVVQQMVDAAVAGVLFTADPVTGRRQQAVIDANPGLGEAVVSGSVDPDHVVVDTRTGAVLDRRAGRKQLAIRARPGGGTEQVLADGAAEWVIDRAAGPPKGPSTTAAVALCLSDADIRRLAELGDRVETHFGAPQDIEWALDTSGRLHLTQSRPITTLFPIPQPFPGHPAADPPAMSQPRVLFCASLAQGLHRPLTPLGLAAFPVVASTVTALAGFPQADRLAGPRALRVAAGRLFVDLTPGIRSRVGRAIVPRVLDIMETRSAVLMRTLAHDPRFATTGRSVVAELAPLLRVAVRARMPLVAAQAIVSPRAARRRIARIAAAQRRRAGAPLGHDPATRLNGVIAFLGDSIMVGPRVLPAAVGGLVTLMLGRRLLGDRATAGELETVLRSLPFNVTTQMDLALWRVAARVRSDPAAAAAVTGIEPAELARQYLAGALPAGIQDPLADFLRRYGHRAVAEIDLGLPRWSEDPEHLLGVLAGYLRLGPEAETPDRHFTAGATEAEAMIATLAGRAGAVRGLLIRFLLGRARQLIGLREMPKFQIIGVFGAARKALLDIGAELAAAGRLAAAQDIDMLDLREIRRAIDGFDARELVRERRAEYAAELKRRHIPRVMLSDGTDLEAVGGPAAGEAAAAGTLTGTPASAGSLTARARVVLDPVGARLEPGEILVAPSTDPGWTPLFLTAGGLVMEMGGANSHGAVVAREYGIPAVVGVAGAIDRIRTGELVTVDGARGVVILGTSPERSDGEPAG